MIVRIFEIKRYVQFIRKDAVADTLARAPAPVAVRPARANLAALQNSGFAVSVARQGEMMSIGERSIESF